MINPIRDTVFIGNQEAYDIWGGVSTTVSGLVIPVGQGLTAAKAAGQTGKVMLGTVGKEVAKDFAQDAFVNAVSSGAGSAAMKVTGNANFSRAVSLASGVAGGSKSGKVLNSLDDIGTSTVKSLNHLDDVADGSNMVGAKGIKSFADLMKPEDAKRYNQWIDLRESGFNSEEMYNLETFGSIKTRLDYTTTTGLKLQGTPEKTTTIVGNYQQDMKYIVDELGNIKSVNFGAKNGGFNVLNVPDEKWAKLGADGFWEQYNKPWLQESINRGDIIKVASNPSSTVKYWYDVDGLKHLTGFGKEIKILEDYGYHYDVFTSSYIK